MKSQRSQVCKPPLTTLSRFPGLASLFKEACLLLFACFVVGLSSMAAADAPGPLRLLAYDRTISKELAQEFTQKTGIPLQIITTASAPEAARVIYTEKQPFDLLLNSTDVIRSLLDNEKLLPIDRKSYPSLGKAIKPQWKKAANDPAGKFLIPLDVAAMGILVNKNITQPPIVGYMSAFRKVRPGGVAVLVDQRDLLAAALLSLGASVNNLSPDNLKAASIVMRSWMPNTSPDSQGIWTPKKHVETFNYIHSGFLQGRYAAALLYSGDASVIMQERPGQFDWINPAEGGLKYLTVFAIPQNCERPTAAHQFIDFMLQPERIRYLVDNAPGLPLSAPVDSTLPLDFYGNPANFSAKDMLDEFTIQKDITHEPLANVQALFDALPAPSASTKTP